MATIRTGKPDVDPGLLGAHAGGATRATPRALRASMAGHNRDGTSTVASVRPASTRRRPARSTRGCRTSRRRRPMERALPMSAAAGPAAAPDLAFSVEDGGRLEHAAVPTLRFALRIESARRDSALGGAVVRAPDRRDAARLRRARAQERLVELFGRPEDWGRNLHALHWTTLNVHVPAVHREHARGAARAVHLRPRGDRRAVPQRARGRRGAARVPVQRHRLLRRRRTGGSRSAGSAGTRRPTTACRWPRGARRWTATSPTRPGCACAARASTGSARLQGAPHAAHLGGRRRRAARARRASDAWTRCARSPTPCSTRATCSGPTGARR